MILNGMEWMKMLIINLIKGMIVYRCCFEMFHFD